MPFIDKSFLLDETESVNRLLITSADDSNVVNTSFEIAKIFQQKGNSVLWIDGNLGEHLPEIFSVENPDLESVLLGKLPLTHALQKKEGISILTGNSNHFLGELPDIIQYQFLRDLSSIYMNFDKIVFAVDGTNQVLQKKWMKESEDIYLLFNSKNLFLNRTSLWLKENASLVKGLIGIGKNDAFFYQ